MAPAEEQAAPAPLRRLRRWQSIAVFSLLDLNDWAIGRFGPPAPAIWTKERWGWMEGVERATPLIRAELEAYVRRLGELPHVAEISGMDPDSDEGREHVPLRTGAWRTVILYANGSWIEETSSHFPETVRLFDGVSPKANVGFSALDPRSHIGAHVGPNRGALRFQLPLIVPGELGDCRIRIGDELVHWVEGEAILFDLSVDHEAWNDTSALRVLLMVEIDLPLPAGLKQLNRSAQYAYRWHPSYRQMPSRIAKFGAVPPPVAA